MLEARVSRHLLSHAALFMSFYVFISKSVVCVFFLITHNIFDCVYPSLVGIPAMCLSLN